MKSRTRIIVGIPTFGVVCVAAVAWILALKQVPMAALIAAEHGGTYYTPPREGDSDFIEMLESIFGDFERLDTVTQVCVHSDTLESSLGA